MSEPSLLGLVIADFTADSLGAVLARDDDGPAVHVEALSNNPVIPVLADAGRRFRGLDFVVAWTRPEAVVPSFAAVLRFEEASDRQLLEETDAYADLLMKAAEEVRSMLVPTWAVRHSVRGLGLMDMTHPRGVGRALDLINARLAERLRDAAGVHLLDSRRWFALAGPAAHDPRLWYMAKVPYGPAVFQAAAQDVRSALRAVHGQARKLIVLDLDDTLWGGILGEVGLHGLRLGGHDPVGEAHVDFQRGLKALTRRGVILGIASKNDEDAALRAMAEHPEMVLGLDDFAGWRINWSDKARNIADLVESLSLGLDAVVFLDDNPAERGRVREALPGVLVPDWPPNPLLFASALEALPWFDTAQWNQEDSERARLYSVDRQRAELKGTLDSVDAWLDTLDIRIRVEALSPANRQRATQLLNKTNQMNLSTRRLTEAELAAWAGEEGNMFWAFRMADRFSDSGVTGLLGVTAEPDGRLRIVDWVLSCRVMGRRMEESMLHVAAEHGRMIGAREMIAEYLPTDRNAPCLEFWRARSGFAAEEGGRAFVWNLAAAYPLPPAVSLAMEVTAA
jgi:FkbH-like protein